ncbi:MATE family efflux transporter [Natrialba sp. INN-245]|uniref:MATE family efflux transporter n=1 Tax=Natrialba sp. INN-245 TaxID=2690967 RepID=UPI0013130F7D|nr:MATE family efflux transporter [Natrialba sp. INN-245]MWV38466.1 MATE family efflux transporter [Natrialba sp. INN-245]
MSSLRRRLFAVWRETFSLSWPVAIQETLSTLMRTVDIIITGLFSPAAVAAVGIADLYAQIPMRIGSGLGAGAIALSSQDTGRGAELTRDKAVTQAIALGFATGLPLILLGYLFGDLAIAILGSAPDVVQIGGLYLMIVFAASPMRIVALTGSRALQGTGDTVTPMYINGVSNASNILLSVVLGLGFWVVPQFGVVGVALATAISRTAEALLMLLAIASDRTTVGYAWSTDSTIATQLVAVAVPNIAEGMTTSIVSYPFNALLLTFGTEVNAAYHIARRIYHQTTGPLYRSYSVASSIIVGQQLGEGDPERARFSGLSIAAFGVLTLGAAGLGLIGFAEYLATLFSNDPTTIEYATDFTRVFGVMLFFVGIFFPIAGALRGAGDTRTPFYARLTGSFGFMLGFSYVTSIVLGYGLYGVYAGMALTYVWWALIVSIGFLWGGWADKAEAMIAERASSSD